MNFRIFKFLNRYYNLKHSIKNKQGDIILKKLPICKACINGTLCLNCQDRYDKGYVNQFDIDLANDFLEIEKTKFPDLKKASFYNAVDVEDIVFLVIGKGHKSKYGSKVLEHIRKIYEIPEIILIEKGPVKNLLERIISPAKLLGLNQIYIPTGEIEYRVVILNEDKDKLRISIKSLEKASSIIIRGIAKISFS